MSEPSNTPSSSSMIYHNQYLHHPSQQPSILPPHTTTTTTTPREYRKGNWTLQETLTLITAKKLDEQRRTVKPTEPNPRTAELRWKWVENYCWSNGCLRSQNQCNDKWDNLLRDFKKAREYESKVNDCAASYWKLEKHQRRERNLPINLAFEVFEALNEVLQRKFSTPRMTPSSSAEPQPVTTSSPAPPPPPPVLPLPPPLPTISDDTDETTESLSETEGADSDTKRRRKLGKSVLKSASLLTKTLMNCEEKREKRHREVIELEERRLQIEETRRELNQEGMDGLISAVKNLSGAIHALVSDRYNVPPS